MKPTKWPGNWKVACHVCGFWFPSSEIKKRWDGVLACEKDWEIKHPQLSIKARQETAVPTFVSKDANPDTFIQVCDINTSSCYADMCTADCAKADNTQFTYQFLLDTLRNGQETAGISSGSSGSHDSQYYNVGIVSNFATSGLDQSINNSTYSTTGTVTYSNELLTSASNYITYPTNSFLIFNNPAGVTIECWAAWSSLGVMNNEYCNILRMDCPSGTDPGFGWNYFDGRAIFLGSGVGQTAALTAGTYHHFCVFVPFNGTGGARFSCNGALIGTVFVAGIDNTFSLIVGDQTHAPAANLSYSVRSIRVTLGDRYGSGTFTPNTYPFPTGI